MKAPNLDKNKCSVLIAELATGHIFTKDLTLFLKGENESNLFQIFDSFQEAKEFALDFVSSNPKFECVLYDWSGKPLLKYDINGKRKN